MAPTAILAANSQTSSSSSPSSSYSLFPTFLPLPEHGSALAVAASSPSVPVTKHTSQGFNGSLCSRPGRPPRAGFWPVGRDESLVSTLCRDLASSVIFLFRFVLFFKVLDLSRGARQVKKYLLHFPEKSFQLSFYSLRRLMKVRYHAIRVLH